MRSRVSKVTSDIRGNAGKIIAEMYDLPDVVGVNKSAWFALQNRLLTGHRFCYLDINVRYFVVHWL